MFIDPCIPKSWPGYQMDYKKGGSLYHLEVKNPEGVSRGVKQIRVDGRTIDAAQGIRLVDDGKPHRVEILMGAL